MFVFCLMVNASQSMAHTWDITSVSVDRMDWFHGFCCHIHIYHEKLSCKYNIIPTHLDVSDILPVFLFVYSLVSLSIIW